MRLMETSAQHMIPTSGSNLMAEILLRLQKGEWIFNILEPAFREELLRVHPECGPHSSITTLTALHYRKRLMPETLASRPSLHLLSFANESTEDLSFWSEATGTISPGVVLAFPGREWSQTISKALEIIGSALPGTLAILQSHASYLCSVSTERFKSASHPHYFGTLFLAVADDPVSVAISLVHEMAHQELFLINLVDRLVNATSDFNLVHAPYQGKTRPPIGRIHSAHALFRMIQLEVELGLNRAAQHAELLDTTVATFSEEELTPFARKLVNEVYQ